TYLTDNDSALLNTIFHRSLGGGSITLHLGLQDGLRVGGNVSGSVSTHAESSAAPLHLYLALI
ncbi:MAG TPA: hypothetical protein VLR10_01445, partial [Nitrososphaeraceae archaeon]|nr:hypothetical protein [Nitrososphaeraceae archaeon]